jgi:tripartite-type tricarboxylate transporter receptor subunit TctC
VSAFFPFARGQAVAFVMAALTLAASTPSIAAEARPFYAGKTITIFTGEPPGGSSDTYARLLARHLPKYIPGAPALVVQNLPGAGTLKAVMTINTSAPADGTALATFSSALIVQAIVAPRRIPIDFRKFSWLGNIAEDIRVCYVWGGSGIASLDAMRMRGKDVFMGATAPGTAGNADVAMLQSLFQAKIRQVQGYEGAAGKRLAVERGEIDGDCAGWTALPDDWLREKKINFVLRLSPTLAEGMDKNIPFGGDLLKDARDRRVYDFLTAPERLGRIYLTSQKVPAERQAILRAAFDAAVKDPALIAEAKRMRLLVTPMTGAEIASRIGELYQTPAELVARARTILGE